MNSPASYPCMDSADWNDRLAGLFDMLKDCTLCPRRCRVDRTAGETGYCRAGPETVVAGWGPHFGEERPLVGRGGSGTIFFSNCNLACVYCQNFDISQGGGGRVMTSEGLAEVMLSLEQAGCHNINLVTPTHQVPVIIQAVQCAAGLGLSVPLVYNCGGYESPETLSLLDGIVDIYMPDLKYADGEAARRYSDAPDYPSVARNAVVEMHRQVGDLVMDERGVAQRGLLVRHLVLPNGLAGMASIAAFLAEDISRNTYLNIMDQYHPCHRAGEHPAIDRCITSQELEEAVAAARRAGISRIDGVTR